MTLGQVVVEMDCEGPEQVDIIAEACLGLSRVEVRSVLLLAVEAIEVEEVG